MYGGALLNGSMIVWPVRSSSFYFVFFIISNGVVLRASKLQTKAPHLCGKRAIRRILFLGCLHAEMTEVIFISLIRLETHIFALRFLHDLVLSSNMEALSWKASNKKFDSYNTFLL